jgi:hypothetical protein
MLISLDNMRKTRVHVRDDVMGAVREVYFDDQQWVVRYFIVTTSHFRRGDVLIAPEAVVRVDQQAGRVELNLTRRQVENSPPVDFAKPVSRQKAEEYIAYYGWPYFRSAPAGSGTQMLSASGAGTVDQEEHWNPHLRSLLEVTGYRIQGSDDHVGHLVDLLADEQSWTLRYLVVDPRSWWPSKNVLLLPGSVEGFDWQHREVRVSPSRERIRAAPRWSSETPLSREDESDIHEHYGLPPYWVEAAGEHPEPASP